jgi:hypothetical protein
LRSETREKGEGGCDERCNRDGGKSLDHDGPLLSGLAVCGLSTLLVDGLIASSCFAMSSLSRESGFISRRIVSS